MSKLSSVKLACLNCRSSKVKCLGGKTPEFTDNDDDDIISDNPCYRCNKYGYKCIWRKSNRTGRPRKNPNEVEVEENHLEYFMHFTHSVPLISDYDVESIKSEKDVFYYAANSIGATLRLGSDDKSTLDYRTKMLSAASDLIDNSLSDIRNLIGLIYLVYDAYGSNNIGLADKYLSYTCQKALEMEINVSPNAYEARVFWELYVLDVLLHLSTSGKTRRNFENTPMNVDIDKVSDDPSFREVYDIRIKVITIIDECCKIKGYVNFDRVSALETMLTNLLLTSQANYHIFTDPTLKELTFTSVMMLFAARIHLHRLAWFSNYVLEFESCSFKQQIDNIQLMIDNILMTHSTLEDNEMQLKMLESYDNIQYTSNQMFEWIRLDQAPNLINNPVHWPFYGCCQLVSAYGQIICLAISNSIKTNYALQPLSSQVVDNAIWKTRSALSNINYAKYLYSKSKQTWKVTEVYESELTKCKDIVDIYGPTGFF